MVASSAAADRAGRPVAGRVAGIIVAGGSSTRMSLDKLWADLGDQPLLAHSLRTFAAAGCCDNLILIVAAGQRERALDLLDRLGVTARIAIGGAQRQDSVRAGLAAAADADWVVIHDAARPLVTADLIQRGIAAAQETGAAIAAMPAIDTIKIVEAGRVVDTPPRASLWQAQTPQVFRRALLLEAHEAATSSATDDAALVEARGGIVRVFEGSYSNLKVTTDIDLVVARALLAARADPGAPAPANHLKQVGAHPSRRDG